MTRALIVVDVQNDYFDGGAMALVGMDEAAANIGALLAGFRAAGAPVIHVQHLSTRPGATFFVPGTPGCDINPAAAPAGDEPVVRKHFPSAFRGTDLDARLKDAGVEQVTICGAMSHMCIDSTTRAAFDLGYGCTVVESACATRDLEFGGRVLPAADVHAAFMAALRVPFAAVVDTAAALEGLSEED